MMKKKAIESAFWLAMVFLAGGFVGSILSERLVSSEMNRMSVHELDHWGRMSSWRCFVRKVELDGNIYKMDVCGVSRDVDGFTFSTFQVDSQSSNMVVAYTPHPSSDHGVFEGRVHVGHSEDHPHLIWVEGFLVKNAEKSFEVAPHVLPERLYVKGVCNSGMSDFRWKLLSMLEK